MTGRRVYIAGAGIISPLGRGLAETREALRRNRSAIRPLDLFGLLSGEPLPVGQVEGLKERADLPRTHCLARTASLEAMAAAVLPPDAVIVGTTTGGILTTEQLLRDNERDRHAYRYHGLATVAEYIAGEVDCRGPALVVSTACSSGAVAIAMALEMLRRGEAVTVLAGGVDSLCRLTYFGFHSLQLVDRQGCRPLDRDRHGMAVAEGSGMLLLTTEKPAVPLAEILGAGLSCDAYHPAAPHPEGRGARMAMEAALADAGLVTSDIDYVSLHGTGTPENDLAEAKALNVLFDAPPPVSSIKGATGHSLAAAGAIEAVVATIAVTEGLLPANTGWQHPDPALDLLPLTEPLVQPTRAVLSNSFGFGGNNGCLVVTRPDSFPRPPQDQSPPCLAIHGLAALTGGGATAATLALLAQGSPVGGTVDIDSVSKQLPPRLVRRLKRLSRMTLALAVEAREAAGLADAPESVFMGTGWGALSETYDFLTGLNKSNEQFPSPTDFVGSVHNGPAGQVAILLGSTGANITMSGGDYSFEQALLAAELMGTDEEKNVLVVGADEAHLPLSPLFDPSVSSGATLAEGGGAFCLNRRKEGALCLVRLPFYRQWTAPKDIELLIERLGGRGHMADKYGFVLAGIPAASKDQGEEQLTSFLRRSGIEAQVIRYRELTGEFASASAVAAMLAASFFDSGGVFANRAGAADLPTGDGSDAILVLGLGSYITAMEFLRP